MLNVGIALVERGLVPDFLLRRSVRRLCTRRLVSLVGQAKGQYVHELKQSAVATATRDANLQHYELPADFFNLVLGPQRKYSSAFWDADCQSLAQAETAALKITMERAELADGMNILELGCGWGSLTLAMAKKYPNSHITAVSNSSSQREFIQALAHLQNLTNITVITQDLSEPKELKFNGPADRIVSVEMFEHVRNYQEFLKRVSHWLKPEGKLFIHIFTHRQYAYLFETEGDHNWMGKYFFTGGQMPSADLFKYFQDDFTLKNQWQWDGTHYQKTSEAWLQNMDHHRSAVRKIFVEAYGHEADVWIQRWRMFFIAVAELFGYDNGTEWGVTHYLFSKKDTE